MQHQQHLNHINFESFHSAHRERRKKKQKSIISSTEKKWNFSLCFNLLNKMRPKQQNKISETDVCCSEKKKIFSPKVWLIAVFVEKVCASRNSKLWQSVWPIFCLIPIKKTKLQTTWIGVAYCLSTTTYSSVLSPEQHCNLFHVVNCNWPFHSYSAVVSLCMYRHAILSNSYAVFSFIVLCVIISKQKSIENK